MLLPTAVLIGAACGQGPLIDEDAVCKVEAMVAEAVDRGATVSDV